MWTDEPREEPVAPVTEPTPGGAYAMITYMVPWGHDPLCSLPIVTLVSLN